MGCEGELQGLGEGDSAQVGFLLLDVLDEGLTVFFV